MADMDMYTIVNKDDLELFDNYISVAVSLSLTVEGLQDYVKEKLENIHQVITSKTRDLPRCTDNCSRKYGTIFANWCLSCQTWKLELEKYKRNAKQLTFWGNLDSSDWIHSPEEIGQIYLKENPISRYGTFCDLGSILSLFRNCNEFNIDRQIIQEVSKVRNEYYAHNFSLKVHTPDKLRCIDSLTKLLEYPSIMTSTGAKKSLKIIKNIYNFSEVTADIVHAAQRTKEIIAFQTKNKYVNKPENGDKAQCENNRIACRIRQLDQRFQCKRTISKRRKIQIPWFSVLIVIMLKTTLVGYIQDELKSDYMPDCLDLNNKICDHQMDNDFVFHMATIHNETSVEREWLQELIEEQLLKPTKGINLIADPGYGNHTIVIDALDECEDSNEKFDILDILILFLHTLPQNIKLILTSRNIEGIVERFKNKDISPIYITHFNENLNSDIEQYIMERKIPMDENLNSQQLKHIFHGNFLYAKHFLDYCTTELKCLLSEVPASLKDVIVLNLKRVFGKKGEYFEKFRPMFEVLVATSKPLNEQMLIEACEPENSYENIYSLIENDLRHFVRMSRENEISISHKALEDTLTDISFRHSVFFIDKKKGHLRLAKFLFKVTNTSKDGDLIDLAHHVALSNNKKFEDLILIHGLGMASRNRSLSSYLFDTASIFNCYKTMEMVIKLVGTKYADQQNKQNRTAAFIAAEIGHEKSLHALLDYGSNITFNKPCINVFELIHLVIDKERLVKDSLFCEFSLLDIAERNGHHGVVKLLVSRQPSLLNHRNFIDASAFHLAIENNHLSVMEEILSKNISFADSYALYVSALYGHYKAMALLLQNGAVDNCLPCIGLIYWRNEYIKHNTFWSVRKWLYTSTTALHIATEKGHIGLIKLLLNQSINALSCKNSFGFTALMIAAAANQAEIFIYLYENGANVSDQSAELKIYNKKYGNDTPKIVSGISTLHILAKEDNTDITGYLISKGVKDLLHYDDNLASTLHYALCYGSKAFISLIEKKVNFSTALLERTIDGETPYQYSARCGRSIDPIGARKELLEELDSYGRSILQIAINHTDVYNKESSAKHLELAISINLNLLHQDYNGNNYLHYAAVKLDYAIFNKTFSDVSHVMTKKLLEQRNAKNLTVFQTIVNSISSGQPNETDWVWKNATFVSYSLTILPTNEPETPFDLCLKYTFENVLPLAKRDIGLMINRLIQNLQLVPLISFFIRYNTDFLQISKELIIEDFEEYFASYPAMLQMFLPVNLTVYCNDKNNNGIVHTVLMNYRGRYWKCFKNFTTWETYFKPYNAEMLNSCFNPEGYNILHKAAIGGNVKFVEFLLNKGMSVDSLTLNNDSLFSLCIRKCPFLTFTTMYPHHFIDTFTVLIDKAISENSEIYFQKENFCLNGKTKFGLVHISAAKGYLSPLTYAINMFGQNIFNCRTLHGISPLDLIHLFNPALPTWLLSNTYSDSFKLPRRIQTILGNKYITNFAKELKSHWKCFLKFGLMKLNMFRLQILNCANSMLKMSDSCIINPRQLAIDNHRHFVLLVNSIFVRASVTGKGIFHIIQLYKDVLEFGLCDRKIMFTLLSFAEKKRTGINYDIRYVPLKKGMHYFNDIQIPEDEYTDMVKHKILQIIMSSSMCIEIQQHERNLKLHDWRKSKKDILRVIRKVNCKKDKTCLVKHFIKTYLNNNIICDKKGFTSLLKPEYYNYFLEIYFR